MINRQQGIRLLLVTLLSIGAISACGGSASHPSAESGLITIEESRSSSEGMAPEEAVYTEMDESGFKGEGWQPALGCENNGCVDTTPREESAADRAASSLPYSLLQKRSH